ncbi:MAG: ribosome maturation factor RimM [Eubacteriales bacterium]
MKEFLELGKILKPQGIRGEVKVDAYTDDIGRFDYLEHVFLSQAGEMRKVVVEAKRTDHAFAYLKLQGIEDRNMAETLRGQYLYIDRKNAAKLPEGRHYIDDMIGLEVVDTNGEILGLLAEVIQTGAADVFRLSGKRGCMFPSTPQVVLKIDIDAGSILVDAVRLQEVCVYDDI